MDQGKEDTLRLVGRKRRSNRRSSILKIRSPSRALSELDPNAQVDEDGTTNTKKLRRSRRVSFSATCQVKEFLKDVPWHAASNQGPGPSAQSGQQGQPQIQPQNKDAAIDLNLYIPPKTFPDAPSSDTGNQNATRTSGGGGAQPKLEDQDADKTKLFQNDAGDMELTTCITETITVDTTVSQIRQRPKTSRASLRGTSEYDEEWDQNEYIDFTTCDDVFTEADVKKADPANKLDTTSALSRIMSGKRQTTHDGGINLQTPGNKTVVNDVDMDFTSCNTVNIEVLNSTSKVDASTALSRIMSGKKASNTVFGSSSVDKTQVFTSGEGEMEMTACITQKISVDDLTNSDVLKTVKQPFGNKTQIFDDGVDMDFTACHTAVIDTQENSTSRKLDTGTVLSRIMSAPKTTNTAETQPNSHQLGTVYTNPMPETKTMMNQTVVDNADMDFTTCLTGTINIPSGEERIETSSALSRIMKATPIESTVESQRLESSSVLARLSKCSSAKGMNLQDQQTEEKAASGQFLGQTSHAGNINSDEPKVDGRSFLARLTGVKNPSEDKPGNRTQFFTDDGDSAAMDFTACLTTNLKQDFSTLGTSSVAGKSMFDQTRVFEGGEDLEFTTCLSKTQLQEFQNGKRDFEPKNPTESQTNGTGLDCTRIFSEGCDMDFTVCNDVTINVTDEQHITRTTDYGDTANKDQDETNTAQKTGFNRTKVFSMGDDMEMTTCLPGEPISSKDIATEMERKDKVTDRTRLYSQGSDDMEFTAQLTNVIVSGAALEAQQKENSSSALEKLPRKNSAGLTVRTDSTSAGLSVRADSTEISSQNNKISKPAPVGLSDITHHYAACDAGANMDLTACPEKTIHVRSSSTSDTDSDHDILRPDDGVPIRLGTIAAPRMTKDGCIYTQATFDSTLKFIGDVDRSGRPENQSRLETVIETSRETSNASHSVNDSAPLLINTLPAKDIQKSNEKLATEDGNATRYFGADTGMDMTECVGGLLPPKTGSTSDTGNRVLSDHSQNKTRVFSGEDVTGAMEMTTCGGKILNQTNYLESTKIQPADMDMTTCKGGILEQTRIGSDSNKTQILDGNTGAMEMTTCYGGILNTTKSHGAPNKTQYFGDEDTGAMELTTCTVRDSSKAPNKTHLFKSDETAAMEMTTCLGGIQESRKNATNKTRLFSSDDTAAMEMTTCQGGIQENRRSITNKTHLFSGDETGAMEMTTCQGGIEENRRSITNKTRLFSGNETAAMEMMTCQGGIEENRTTANKTRLFSGNETGAMEMTTCQGGIEENRTTANKTRLFSGNETGAMEMTTCQGGIEENRTTANKTRLFSGNETAAMEMTTCQGGIQENRTTANNTRLFSSNETAAMEMTTCQGGVEENRTTANKTHIFSGDETAAMEMTTCQGEIEENRTTTNKTRIFSSDETAAMEMTTCQGEIEENRTTANKTRLFSGNETAAMEMTTCQGGIEENRTTANKTRLFSGNETAAMEMTTCQGGIEENRTTANKTRLFSGNETAAMEMTTCQGGIQENRTTANKTRLFSGNETGAMEMTTCQGGIEENGTTANKTRLFSGDETAAMEMTTCQGEIEENRTTTNKTRIFSSDETAAMEMTTCQGEIEENRTTTNKTRIFSSDDTAAMEMTTCQGEIEENRTTTNKTRIFSSDDTAAMEMTHCAGKILEKTRLSSVQMSSDISKSSEIIDGQSSLSETLGSRNIPVINKEGRGEKTKIFDGNETAAMEMTTCTGAILDKTDLPAAHLSSKDMLDSAGSVSVKKLKITDFSGSKASAEINDMNMSLWDEERPDTEDLAPLHLSASSQLINTSKSCSTSSKTSGSQETSAMQDRELETAKAERIVSTSVNGAMTNSPEPEPSQLELNVSKPTLKPIPSKPLAPVSMQPPWEMSVYNVPMLGTSSSQLSLVEISYFDDCQPQTIDDYLQLFNIPRESARRNSTIVRPLRMELPTSAAESLSQSFLDVPRCDLLKKATAQLEQKKNSISESLNELEMELMQNPPEIFRVIQKATADERAAMKQKYRDLYKACYGQTAAARRTIKCEFVESLNNKYQEQVEIAEKMKSELLDKIEFSAEVQNELDDVNAAIKQDIIALTSSDCATPEQALQLTSLDQRLQELEKLCSSREERLKNVRRQITEVSEKHRVLEEEFSSRLLHLFPSSHRSRQNAQLKRILSLCSSNTVRSTQGEHLANFLFDSLSLQITFGKENENANEITTVTSFKMTSHLSDDAADYAQLCHHFITSAIDQEKLQTTYPVKADLQHLIHDVAIQVAIASDLAENVMDISLLHKVKVEGFVISVEFSSLAAFAKFVLNLTIDPTSYPTTTPTWTLKSFIGSTRREDIEGITESVEPGLGYLFRLVSAVDNYLYSNVRQSS